MGKKKDKIKEEQLQGFNYFKMISKILESLHDAGCERDRAHNRKLHMDQYMSLILLSMFSPICSSLRSIQQASELKKVQRKLGCARASLGSLSEATGVFDSDLMIEIIESLASQLKPISSKSKLNEVSGILTAVDGTLIPALSKMTWALWKSEKQAVKTHVQFDLQKHVPIKIKVTDGNGNERVALAQDLESGRIYVADRGYASFELFERILEAKSSFVCRVRDNSSYKTLEEFELSEEAQEANILFDRKVKLGAKSSRELKDPIRLIAIKCTPHKKRIKTGRGGPAQGEMLLIATDRFDLDADVIGLMFKMRWSIEIFFRFFKHVLGCRHLLSEKQNGIELQTYAAIIACMLITLTSGRKPTLRTYEMICWYFTGMADEEELLTHISKLKKHD